MIKKLDKFQIGVLLALIVLVVVMLAVPYRSHIDTGELKHGYNHLVNWAVVVYAIRLGLQSFGWEMFGIEKHLIGLAVLEASGIYIKAFIFKSSYDIIWSGIIAEVVVVAIFGSLVYLDKTLYFTGNKKELEL